VEINKASHQKLYHMYPEDHISGVTGNVFSTGRVLVGRAESCDFVINSNIVSAVHAVLEITPKGVKLYDMNSRNGTYINGEKIVTSELKVGDTVAFGNVKFTFKEYISSDQLPPVLDSLAPDKGEASTLKTQVMQIPEELRQETQTQAPQAPTQTPPAAPMTEEVEQTKSVDAKEHLPEMPVSKKEDEDDTPYIVYPLGSDPKADYSEYIFEDTHDLYPIFKYETNKQAVEVIILYYDSVFSVDYLPQKDGVYSIVGANPNKKEIEFPYLGKEEKTAFVEIQGSAVSVNQLHSYSCMHLNDKGANEVKVPTVDLMEDDIIRMVNGHLEIYIRKVPSPPKVKAPPFFSRDKTLRKLVLLTMLLIMLPVAALYKYEVDEEMEKEKDPQRIATILYKQKLTISKTKAVEKTKKAPPKKQTAPKKKVVKKPTKQKPTEAKPKTVTKNVVKKADPGSKKAPVKQEVKRVKKPAPRTQPKVAKSAASAAKTIKTATTQRAVKPSPNKGVVDVYKSADFRSTVSALMAKGGSLRGAKVQNSASTSAIGSASVGGGVADNLKKADVGTEIGSLTGATVGKIGQSKGAEGLSAKKGIYMAGIPSETVVMGSMDPDVIRRILREHIPQFRYCYQKELDRNTQDNLSGTIGLQFTIGASGHVSRAGINNRTRLPGSVKSCVVGVLRGIKFPRPLGGGVVEVNQPFNFYPKRL
jgi:pSer/pThr/pTyr-binding forkhead associated (FHA) protein/outer membrane biosynthesis protein TonB